MPKPSATTEACSSVLVNRLLSERKGCVNSNPKTRPSASGGLTEDVNQAVSPAVKMGETGWGERFIMKIALIDFGARRTPTAHPEVHPLSPPTRVAGREAK